VLSLQLAWQQSAVLAAAASSAALAARNPAAARWFRRAQPYLSETALIAGLYSLWRLAGKVSLSDGAGALRRAHQIDRFERRIRLPSELSVQHLVVGHSWAEEACNLYYASMHFGALGIFLLWLFVRHRDRYPFVRMVLVVCTMVCLSIQLLPVAPPRLLPALGYRDIAAEHGMSVYSAHGLGVDQLAAMPSVHVGWALLVAWGVIANSPSRWRFVALLHPVATLFVIVATANHFWADALVAAAVLLMSIALIELVQSIRRRRALAPPLAVSNSC
jgi:hypothetical protein